MEQLKIRIDIKDPEFKEALTEAFAILGDVDTASSDPHVILMDVGKVGEEKNGGGGAGPEFFRGGRIVYPAGKGYEESLEEAPYFIDLYDDIYTIKSKLDYISGRSLSWAEIKKRRVALMLFLSDQGGAGCTSLAISSALALRRMYGGKALYLSLNPFNREMKFLLRNNMEQGEGHGFMKWLYGLKKGKIPPAGMVIKGGDEIDLVDVPIFNKNWSFFKSEDMEPLLNMADQEGYRWMIVDAGNAVTGETIKLTGMADEVLFVTKDGHEPVGMEISSCVKIANGVDEDFEESPDVHIIPFSPYIGSRALETEYGTEVERMLYGLGGINAKMRFA